MTRAAVNVTSIARQNQRDRWAQLLSVCVGVSE